MSVVPGPTASRGGIVVQPTYFTSSLYVDPCREDIEALIQEFSRKYHENPIHSFGQFKSIWVSSGWQWMHFKVFDAYARNTFLRVTIRLFMGTFSRIVVRYINTADGFILERMKPSENVLARVGALYGVYVFYNTQPSTSAPRLHPVSGIEVSCGGAFSPRVIQSPLIREAAETLQSLLVLPSLLDSEQLSPLRPQVTHVLSQLINSDAFYILPSSDLELCKLPREIFVPDNEEETVTEVSAPARKRGRPSRRDQQKRANHATASLDAWLKQRQASDPLELHRDDRDHAPGPISSSRDAYLAEKITMLDMLARDESGGEVLRTANEAVLRRLREIDEMAASQGLEVGGEGGEKTGLARIEKVVGEMEIGSCGILGIVGDLG